MKQRHILQRGWEIKGMNASEPTGDAWQRVTPEGEWFSADMPSVVQEVLWAHDRLDRSVLETGEAEACRWVSDQDWAFRCSFECEKMESTEDYLYFKGLDTLADVVLNGERLARSESIYKPLKVDVTGKLRENNELLLYFHAPNSVLPLLEQRIPPEQAERIRPLALLRKGHGDFSPHAGVMPYFTPIGVYDEIQLVRVPVAEIEYVDVETAMNLDRSQAFVRVTPAVFGDVAEALVRVALYAPDGTLAVRAEGRPNSAIQLTVDHPQLWWPRNYGDQPLYRLQTTLVVNGREEDADVRTIGLREIREVGALQYTVNGVRLRLWGSCIVPLWGPSHRYQQDRTRTLLDLAENANINALRIWGPSQQYSDQLYDEMDRRGILIWQDFPTVGAHISEDEDFVQCVLGEAEALVRRLKHHPCILHWCGGNESVYMCDLFQKQDLIRFGHRLIYDQLRDVVHRLDPHRPYRVSSPYGGEYANDAAVDTHGSRASLSFLPGEQYGNFFSENIRTCIPEIKSLKRFIPEDQLWPADWQDRAPFGRQTYLPPAWARRTMNHWSEKAGPFERFYDADTPEELVYKFNAAAAYDIRLMLNASRRGKSADHANEVRRCHGHLVWKLTTAWPQIYCALIDYYLEPGQSYYALRQAYAPVQVSIDVQDQVYLWGVNDTQKDFHGTLAVDVYDLEAQESLAQYRWPAAVLSGDARILADLSRLGQFTFTSVVAARLLDENGEEISRDFQYMKPERYLPFPDAKLQLEVLPDHRIAVSTDAFARCVTLEGDENGDAFGWYFEDNYFDLLPGERRVLTLKGRHTHGTISARAHYAQQTATVVLR